jgi:hypothetical protein
VFFAVVMLVSINFEFRTTSYKSKFALRPKTGRFVSVAVTAEQTLFSAYKMADKSRPTQFIITDRGNSVFYESDLEEWLARNPSDTAIKNHK